MDSAKMVAVASVWLTRGGGSIAVKPSLGQIDASLPVKKPKLATATIAVD